MKVSRSFLRALNVRRDEWWLVQKLFLLQFFQGAGIAFFFTAAFSRFLEHFPVSGLAYVFILSSFLLWITGFIYSKLEHRLSSYRLHISITLVLAASMLLFRAGAEWINDNWFYFLMLAWFNVLYLLNNLMFWGIASQLYDVRQSKRLFGVISAGDIPAKFIGYSVALFIVSYTGTANLLLAGFVFIGLSIPFLRKVLQAEKASGAHGHHPVKHHTGLHTVVKDYSANILIRRVALLSLIVSACIILINYGFYAEVKNAYKNDVEFARFIAFFLAIARLIALVIKILFTSRLLYWLGNRFALSITPVLLITFIILLLISETVAYESKTVLYIFGLAAISVDVLRSAINSPVLLTMMQPLTTPERLRAHNIVKGIMDPFAYLFSGLFILVFIKLHLLNLQILGYLLLGLAIAWIIGIFMVHQQYLKTLIKTISSRYFTQEEFNLYDPAARELIEKKINTGTELEVLYILKMLGTRRSPESNRLIIHALHHPSGKVVGEALRVISELHIKEAESSLSSLLVQHPLPGIRSQAVKVLAEIAFQDSIIVPLMNSEDPSICRSSIVSVLNHSRVAANRLEAENKIRELLASDDPVKKREAAVLLCETSQGNFDQELTGALSATDPVFRKAVIRAIGHHPSPVCLEQLTRVIDEEEKEVIEALILAKEKGLPFIRDRVLRTDCPAKQKENLLNAIGRISGKASHEILLGLISQLPGHEHHIIKVLHRCHFKAGKQEQLLIEEHIRRQLGTAAALLHMQKQLWPQQERYKAFFGSLQLELNQIRETLLFLFSFIYDREKIGKIKAAIEINKKETNANAIELVDMTVKKEFANPFNAAFEQGDLEHRCDLLKGLFPKNLYPDTDAIISDILADKMTLYNNWSKTCSLYYSKKWEHRVDPQLISHYLVSENPLLKETAGYASRIN
jgi:HEAT repeat protein